MGTNFKVHICLALCFVIYLTDSLDALSIIPNCAFEDTVDLTGSERFSNGSYLYEGVLVPPHLIGTYDYIQLYDGEHQKVPRHLRGCACQIKNCFKLCCNRWKTLQVNTDFLWECAESSKEYGYTPYVNITSSNDRVVLKNALKDFLVQVGLPCEDGYKLNSVKDPRDNWTLYENGILFRKYDNQRLTRGEYCMTGVEIDGVSQLQPYNCPILYFEASEIKANTIVMFVSLPFLLLTILIYCAIPELYKNLYNKCLICYMFALAIASTMIIVVNLRTEDFSHVACTVMGSVAYYFYLCAFFWLNSICYDIWATFSGYLIVASQQATRRHFRNYSLYAWGVPLLMTIVTMTLQFSDIDIRYKSGIGVSHCWLKMDDWSAMMYFHGPCLLLIAVNTVMFCLTVHKIYSDSQEIKCVSRSLNCTRHRKSHEHSAWLFLRLFIVMGVNWILEMIGYIMGPNAIFQVADYFNASQGLIIFTLFILKKSTLLLIKKSITTSECKMIICLRRKFNQSPGHN
ncbi:probable G-protein coupled receptor Mth-like 3 [Bactrocera dorsalis]|uniref:Probable G-protein coupled receptor Mth-like 3 n=1 Tax=Bactrocera dorsalis TaxID=27457 RepID=A0A6I9UUE5_BACDO|nr:probable G-protein coupled receptor Mth-like 3 [Bactrocera dorsalis]